MALNKTILKKLVEKTEDDINLRKFLTEIIQFESDGKSWYEKEYLRILENYCGEDVER